MKTALSYPKRFFGPLTAEQVKEADEGNIALRVIKKIELGARITPLELPIVITMAVAAMCWKYDVGLSDLLDPADYATKISGALHISEGTYMVAIAPVVEELACRGILQPILIGASHRLMGGKEEMRSKAVVFGIIGQALLFSGLHEVFPQKVAALSGGLLYGYMKEQTAHKAEKESEWRAVRWGLKPIHFFEGLVATMAAHATHNGLVWAVMRVASEI